MGAFVRAHRASADRIAFRCPGCESAHMVNIGGPWKFNGNFERPTVTPSINITIERTADAGAERLSPRRCHSIVTDGRIQFLGDSTHALTGQTVDLPEWETAA